MNTSNQKHDEHNSQSKLKPLDWVIEAFWAPARSILEQLPRWVQLVIAGAAICIVVVLWNSDTREWFLNKIQAVATNMDMRFVENGPEVFQIVLFYPDPHAGDTAADDGRVQREGFTVAVSNMQKQYPNALLPIRKSFRFRESNDTRPLSERLMEMMKTLYEEEDARVFVLTMSGAVESISPLFKDWRTNLKKNNKPLPLLVATVASAPALADRSHGLFRYYIRSQEESALLAELAWARGAKRAAVFYITRTAGGDDDTYGRGGRDEFVTRFEGHGGAADTFAVIADGSNAKTLTSRVVGVHEADKYDAVFVVGYGEMFKMSVAELIEQGFPGTIYCVSTLTVSRWQPLATSMDSRIITVAPVWRGPVKPPMIDYNVVRLFPKLLTERLVEAQVRSKTYLEFQDTFWSRETFESDYSIMLTVDGDSIVELRANEKWR